MRASFFFTLLALLLGVSSSTAVFADRNSSSFQPSPFKRIITIVLENEDAIDVLANDYMWSLSKKGTYLSNLYALTHPSQPNYIAMTSGDLCGVTHDGNVDLDVPNIVDLFDKKGVSWKSYAEAYPGNCFTGESHSTYRRKHVPFISYNNIRENATRCANIVSGTELMADYKAGGLPQYSLYTPDMNNDGHDTDISYSARWVKFFIEPLLADPHFMDGTLIVITYDEGSRFRDNKIYTVLLGHGAQPNTEDSTHYTLYDLLRLVEDNFELGSLGLADARSSASLLASYQQAPPSTLHDKPRQPLSPLTIIITITLCTISGGALIAAALFVFAKRTNYFQKRGWFVRLGSRAPEQHGDDNMVALQPVAAAHVV